MNPVYQCSTGKARSVSVVCLLFLALAASYAWSGPPDVRFASVRERREVDRDTKDHNGRGDLLVLKHVPKGCSRHAVRMFSFESVAVPYQIGTSETVLDGKVTRSGLGSRWPRTGWYPGGTLNVHIDGKSLAASSPVVSLVNEGGPAVQALYETEHGNVRVQVRMLPGDDKMLWRVRFDLARPAKSIRACLLCYPGAYAKRAKDRARVVVTAARVVAASATAGLGPEELWLLVADRNYCVENNRGAGPSAVAWEPGVKATVKVKDYSVQVWLDHPLDRRDLHFILWEFPSLPFDEARRYMKGLKLTAAEAKASGK